MTQPIVIAFHPDGVVEYTRNSQFSPFDGEGRMDRVTEIRKSRHSNSYYIEWQLGMWEGSVQTRNMSSSYMTEDEIRETTPPPVPGEMGFDPIRFTTYEGAVRHEVALLNAMRKAGVRFSGE